MRWCVVLAFAPALALGQVAGVVRDQAAGTPLPGAVVSIIDSGGVSASRTITDAAGRFNARLMPRASRLHVIRIGYRPIDLPLQSLRHTPLELRMERIQIGRASCRKECRSRWSPY